MPVKLPRKKPSRPPLLNTNGFPTLLLVFHPLYQAHYRYEADLERDDNQVLIRFRHIPGMRSTIALLLKDRIYDLDLEGTALVDCATGAILKINARLEAPLKGINVESLDLEVVYKAQKLSPEIEERLLPSSAVINIQTALQHWRNVHLFSDYKRFTVRSTVRSQETLLK
jgi:hypothetical protein